MSKTADRRNPILVKITSNGDTIGHLTPKEFKEGVGGSKGSFLKDLIQDFNAMKSRIGEPERAETMLNV